MARRLPGHIDRNARLVDALNGFRRWCWYLSVPSSSPNIAGPALSGLLVAVVVVEMIAVMAVMVVMVKMMTLTTTTAIMLPPPLPPWFVGAAAPAALLLLQPLFY